MKILTKFFSNKYYRDQFVSGSLYFSSLTEYTKDKSERKLQQLADAGNIEAKAELDKLKNNEQRDIFEGTIAAVPKSCSSQVSKPFLPYDLTNNKVCDERFRAKGYDYCNVQCFCMLETKYTLGRQGSHKMIDIPDMGAFGDFSVIVLDPEKLIKRVINAVNALNYGILCGPVSYHPLTYEDKKVVGGRFVHIKREDSVSMGDILETIGDNRKYDAFDKWEKYHNQREWRIVINKHKTEDAPIRLEVGDLSDILVKCDASKFEKRIKKLIQNGRFCSELKGFTGNVDRAKMRNDFYELGNKEGYVLATLGQAEYDC